MHQIGDRVIYGMHGICEIIGVEIRPVDRKKIEYFVLKPIDQPDARCYVPTQNKIAVAKLRKLLTPVQIEEILTSDAVHEKSWIDDESRRKQYYRELLAGGDRAAILRMINTLYLHKKEQAAAGRKFHLCDETFLNDAQKLLRSEFAAILEIPYNQVDDYIIGKMLRK